MHKEETTNPGDLNLPLRPAQSPRAEQKQFSNQHPLEAPALSSHSQLQIGVPLVHEKYSCISRDIAARGCFRNY